METLIESKILKEVFSEYPENQQWDKLKPEIQEFGCSSVFVRPVQIMTFESINLKHHLPKDMDNQIEFFKWEKKLAVEFQQFELASNIQEVLNGGMPSKESIFYLNYSIQKDLNSVCSLYIETNLLSFKYKLIELFSII